MTQFALAARAQIRNIVLCTLATLTLAACGGGEAGSSSAAAAATTSDATASDSSASLVSSNVGMIDRSQGIDTTATTATVANTGAASTGATVASSTSSSSGTASSVTTTTANTTPASGTTSGTTSVTGTTTTTTTTVAANNKSTAPVKTTTTNGVATLDWLPPTENSDGSALTNLAGYTVYYGTSPGSLTQSIKVTNPGLTAYTVTNLSTGTWYFAVTSYSSTGVESTRTGTVSTTI